MITSMTGFGRAEVTSESGMITAEIRSVNHRYADYSIRLPRNLACFEDQVKGLIKKRFSRGYFTCKLSWEQAAGNTGTLSLDPDVIGCYQELFRRMNDDFGIEGKPTIDTFTRLGDIFTRESSPEDEEKLLAVVEQVMGLALDELEQMRKREGQSLAADIFERLDVITARMEKAALRGPIRLEKLKNRLREKVTSAVAEEALDENRLITEITIYADKWDFSEEEVRFRSHLEAVRAALEQGGAVGRKLNFLLQELNREVNTVASKANDAEIAQHMIACKEEIEKIREQVENIE